jgi:hypothetical protein
MKDGWKEMTACQETMEACLECEEPTSVDTEPKRNIGRSLGMML